MGESKLNIVERQVDDVMVVTLTGQILLDDGDLAFRRQVHDLIGRGCVRIVVDLAGVTYIDSSGVGMLAAKLKTVRESGGDMRLVHLTSRSQRLLGMMKLVTVFETFENEAEAVRSFTARPRA
ncbi:MAG: STAS domain-containing protein [Acidobacteria bacterium]|nr:STAS domain-containing protein [Acidobacteriota bacterium]MCA1649974.1 STAS domain-containing protein [Acidobacteriota bacterium]